MKLAVEVGVGVDEGGVESRNSPLRTAFRALPPVLVTLITRLPETSQSRYTPLAKDEIDSVSSTVPEAASLICTVSARPLLSQSSK